MFSQGKVRLDDYTQKSMIQKIINMIQTGDEDFSYVDVKKSLEKKLQEDVGTERTTTKPKNVLTKEVRKLKSQIDEIDKLKRDITLIQKNIQQYEAKRVKLNDNINDIEKAIEIKEQIEKEIKYEKARYDAKLDVQKEEKERFEKNIRIRKRIDSSIIIVMNIVLLIAILNSNYKFLFFVPILISILAIYINNKYSYRIDAPKINIGEFDEVKDEVIKSEKHKLVKLLGEEKR